MLKRIRVVISIMLFTGITLYFLDFVGFLPEWLNFLTKIQLIPALLALNVLILAGLALLTFVFGRIYCSSICPLGVYQDMVAWISKKVKKKKRYSFSKAKNLLRWSIVAATLIGFLFGFTFLLGLLDPYGAYGRIATHIFRPAYMAGNNLLDTVFSSFGNYTFYSVAIYRLSIFSTIIALITLLIVGYLAWKNGRTYCNTICPVGTILGAVSSRSLFKIRFTESSCNKCGLCAMKCKASCIDAKNMQIDHSRCVTCFNCIEACNRDAMEYDFTNPFERKKKKSETTGFKLDVKAVNQSRRRFLSTSLVTGLSAGTLLAQEVSDVLLPKKELKRKTPIAPPGALNFDHFREKCISCHLCVSKCPSHVIKPAFLEYGIGGMMQPKLYFDHGFCNYDCTVCCDVCPTDALTKLTMDEKHHTQMGQVQLIIENCIVYYDETNCGACSEHCPTQAVRMVPYKGALTIPEIEPEICVGCGGCEYVCPAIPFKAIYVEGLRSHNIIDLEKEEQEEITVDDFGF